MHRETKSRRRSLMLLVLVLAAVALLGIMAVQAFGLPTFNQADKGVGPCDNCHKMAPTHDKHASVTCATCHTTNTATPPLPSACASCHTAAAIMAKATHTAAKCGTTDGCHGYVAPVQPTIKVDTVVPSSKVVKVKKTIKFSGGVTPVTTAATSVSWVVEMKSGNSWKQVKKGSAKLALAGGAMRFSYSYKPLKKGSFRTSTSFYNLPGGAKTTSKAVLFRAR